ncbi:hypothetical protein ABT340_39710 [Streptosporangium sp. NPDC000239]|uniref:hypothetical protein n=1 Tax=Streptosporangium sp. NPDC000239 TaxID=3154248 RepID=UPI00332E1E0A
MFYFQHDSLGIGSIGDDVGGGPDLTKVDKAAEQFYRVNQDLFAGYGVWSGGTMTMYYPDLWLICVRATRTGQSPEWLLYAFTSRDTPGWPTQTFTVAPPDAAAIARGLVGEGHSVALRHYATPHLDFQATASTVSL